MRSPDKNENYVSCDEKLCAIMDEFYENNKDLSPCLIKSKLHEVTAEIFNPIIFNNSPFFYETGLRASHNWGTISAPTLWFKGKMAERFCQSEEYKTAFDDFNAFRILTDYDRKLPDAPQGKNFYSRIACYRTPTPGFDTDHNSVGYSFLFKEGLDGIIEKIETELKKAQKGSEKEAFLLSCKQSCKAIIKIAHKFANAAEKLLPECENDTQKKYVGMIAKTARRIPEKAPESFYEGLCMILFIRETVGTLEGVGVSVFGQVDMLLEKLYKKDIENGLISKAEAYELLRMWLIPHDIKFNSKNSPWPESSTCIALGGCDENGNPVFNEISEMIMQIHFENKLITPKLNCRYSKNSPEKYLKLLSEYILKGHNNFALSCDDVIIPSLLKCGVSLEDARRYLNGGCQETMIEGAGHTAGAYLYILIPEILNLTLLSPKAPQESVRERVRYMLPKLSQAPESFEEFYSDFIKNARIFIEGALNNQAELGRFQKDINPCPLFSTMHEGCIESGADYTQGGAKYNLSTVCFCGIATLIDSLFAIKKLCFDDKSVSFDRLKKAIDTNWENDKDLQILCRKLPKYGHGISEVDDMARLVMHDIDEIVTKIPNERGGKTITSTFAYYLFKSFSAYMRASADGRCDGEYLSQGISASKLCTPNSVTEVFSSVREAKFSDLSGVSVLDIQITQDFSVDTFCALLKAASDYGCPNLQPSCVCVEDLIKAKAEPENYKNLIVRVAGLSVYFVNLEDSIKDEIISRNLLKK